MDMDRPRLAVVLSACLLALLLLADATLAGAAVTEHPKWGISEGSLRRTGVGHYSACPFPCVPGENWTYFALFVEAGRGQVAEVNDLPMQAWPYALYAFDSGPLMASSPPVKGRTHASPQLFELSEAEWNAGLLRPSLVRLQPALPHTLNGTERLGSAPALARATRTSDDPGGGVLFVWANRTADQAPAEAQGRLAFAVTLAAGERTLDPTLAGAHPWLAAAEAAAFLVLVAAVGGLLRSRRREAPPPPLTPGEELLALLERSEGYLRGLRNTAAAGLAVFAVAGLLAAVPLAQQLGAVRTLHGTAAAVTVGAGFVAVYVAIAILWWLQLARVTRELRRLRSLRAAAGP